MVSTVFQRMITHASKKNACDTILTVVKTWKCMYTMRQNNCTILVLQ